MSSSVARTEEFVYEHWIAAQECETGCDSKCESLTTEYNNNWQEYEQIVETLITLRRQYITLSHTYQAQIDTCAEYAEREDYEPIHTDWQEQMDAYAAEL